MNIFQDAEDVAGRIDVDKITGDAREFWRLAKELRPRLGNKAYLLDSFLSCLLEGLATPSTGSVVEDGFAYGCVLRSLCSEVLDGKESAETLAHPLYQTVKSYIDEHPLPYQERFTRLSIYYAALADDLLRYSIAEFTEEMRAVFGEIFDSIRMRDLYHQLITLLKETDSVETLNSLIRSRFQAADAASVFLQGMNNEFLYALTFRDAETNKQIFQLLLDNESV